MDKIVKLNFVKSVSSSRVAPTYDLEIDSHEHAFFAQHPVSKTIGISHNSATICIFDKDEEEMLKAKTGNWFVDNPQRGRSNNSALIIRDDITREEWANIMTSVKDFGEPGFIFSDSTEFTFNPCVTGDALVTVCDHGLMVNGEIKSRGTPYQIPMKMLVELFETSDLCPMVLSYNIKTGKMEFDEMTNAAMTRQDADVIKLTLGDGTFLKCTPDHKIFTENRGWVEAKDLTVDDVLITI